MTDRQSMVMASEGGKLYHYVPAKDSLVLLFKDDRNEPMMGLEREGEFLFLAGKSRIYKFKEGKIIKTFSNEDKPDPEFHQMTIINNFLYVTVTRRNEIWKFDLGLNQYENYKIDPPDRHSPVIRNRNYNHLNNIFYHNKRFYICLNMLNKPNGVSGVCVLDDNMKEVDRFEYGWETHNFIILDNKKYVLTASASVLKIVGHVHKGGLLVDGKLVFEYNPDLYYCKGLSIDENYIYIVGQTIKRREDRKFADGILFVLDRDFKPVFERIFILSGGFGGCLLDSGDLTRG